MKNTLITTGKIFSSLGLKTGLYNSGSIHFAIKDIVLENYLKIIENYDYMIYSRFDQFYVGKQFEAATSEKKIYIPAGEDYFGINDRHAIVETSVVKQFWTYAHIVMMIFQHLTLPNILTVSRHIIDSSRKKIY